MCPKNITPSAKPFRETVSATRGSQITRSVGKLATVSTPNVVSTVIGCEHRRIRDVFPRAANHGRTRRKFSGAPRGSVSGVTWLARRLSVAVTLPRIGRFQRRDNVSVAKWLTKATFLEVFTLTPRCSLVMAVPTKQNDPWLTPCSGCFDGRCSN